MNKLAGLALIVIIAVGVDALYRINRTRDNSENRMPPFPKLHEITEEFAPTDAGEIDPYTMEDPIDRKMVAFDQTFDETVARPDLALSRFDKETNEMRDIPVSDCLRKSLILQKLGKKATPKALAAHFENFDGNMLVLQSYASCQAVATFDPSWCDLMISESEGDRLATKCKLETVIFGLIPYYYFFERFSEIRFNRMLKSKNVDAADEWVKVYRIFDQLERKELDSDVCYDRYSSPVMEIVCEMVDDGTELTNLAASLDTKADWQDVEPGDIEWMVHSLRTRDPRFIRYIEDLRFKTWTYSLLMGKSFCGEMLNYQYSMQCGVEYPLPY